MPEIGREISQLPSAGRGVTIDSDGFGARDIRFHPVGVGNLFHEMTLATLICATNALVSPAVKIHLLYVIR